MPRDLAMRRGREGQNKKRLQQLTKENHMSIDTLERTAKEASPEQQASGAGRLLQAIEPLRSRLSTAYGTAQEKSNQAIHSAETYIQRSPFKAIAYVAGIAVALGILGGALLGRRNGNRRTGGGEE
jgi:ElaB/YqjD/DUF883 family membrane-anchored ribosome-binding protein